MGIPQEIAERIERGVKIYYGIRKLLQTLKEQQCEFENALEQGAEEVVLPATVENEGLINWTCCEQVSSYRIVPLHTIYLNFEHTVWVCPKCWKVYAFRIEQPEEE